jgi:ornithine carbamoyltransferase
MNRLTDRERQIVDREYNLHKYDTTRKQLVIAESHAIFLKCFPAFKYHYVSKPALNDLRGYADTLLILFGRYWRRKDWDDEILHYCHNHNIQITKMRQPFCESICLE